MEQMLDELFALKGVRVLMYSYRRSYEPRATFQVTIERECEGDTVKIERTSYRCYSDALQDAYMAFQPLLQAYPKHERYDNLLEAPSQDEELRSNIEVPF